MKNIAQPFTGLKWKAACIFVLMTITVMSQETILVASQTAGGTGGESTWSVGQIAFRSFESEAGAVMQGVQQPYEIFFMTGLEDDTTVSLTCQVFPNPAVSEVRLKIDKPVFESLSYTLSNLNGVVLRENRIVDRVTVLQLTDFPANFYILTVFEDGKQLKSWKIIKKQR